MAATIEIEFDDVLDARADAVVLTIDGARRGLEGNIARAFARRWPDAWTEIEDSVRYPLALGNAVAVNPEEECGFAVVLVASTLHHVDILDTGQKTRLIRAALSRVIQLARLRRVRKLAMAPFTGGWRLELHEALHAMFQELRMIGSIENAPCVALHFRTDADLRLAVEIAGALDVPLACSIKALERLEGNSASRGDR
jgi:hypothetical protein